MMKPLGFRGAVHVAGAVALALVLGLFGVATATAGTIVEVSSSGTYAVGTPTSSWTAAGDPWTFSFLVNTTPTISSFTTGTDFDLPFTNFVYTLNGSPVDVSVVDVEFFSSGDGGLMNVCFFGCTASGTVTNGFEFFGPQAYSGPESAPTILSGTFPAPSPDVEVDSTETPQADGTVGISPEPSTAGLGAAGLLILAAVNFLRKKPAALTLFTRR